MDKYGQWISVKDRLPDKKGDYIVNCHHSYGEIENDYIQIIHFRGKKCWATGNDYITHWMQKPETPKMRKDKNND